MTGGEDGKCTLTADNECICDKEEGEPEPDKDPCGKTLNPECNPDKCEMPGGEEGKCTLTADNECICDKDEGEPDPDKDPCGEELNPECREDICDLPDETKGFCQMDGESCICAPLPDEHPCGELLNPVCDPAECTLPDNEKGICELDLAGEDEACVCTKIDPCGRGVNAMCSPVKCLMHNGLEGRCGRSSALDCDCQDSSVIPDDPCGPIDNLKCEPNGCETLGGKPGVCGLRGLVCSCVETTHDDACSSSVNPQCEPRTCETADGLKGECTSRSVGMVINRCLCSALPDSCKEAFDCLDLVWPIDCLGRWECKEGTCSAVCDIEQCGNDECEPYLGESRTSCSEDCEDYCFKNSDCGITEYCEFPEGQCKAPGKCERRPPACPGDYDPVCGCDDRTYPNSCSAAQRGVSLFSDEACISTFP